MVTGSDKKQNYIQNRDESRGVCDEHVPFLLYNEIHTFNEQSRVILNRCCDLALTKCHISHMT